jgi:hypothetical protein
MDAAGIGSGTGRFPLGISEVTQITIVESFVSAAGSNGAGIGTGRTFTGGISTVGKIAIVGGIIDVNSSNGPGIGCHDGSMGSLTLSGNISLRFRAGSIEVSSIVLSQLSLTASTPGKRVFGSSPAVTELHALLLLYESVSDPDEPLGRSGIPILHIGDVKLPHPEIWRLSVVKSDYSNSFAFNSSQFRSFAIFLKTDSTYKVNASTKSTNGHLDHPANESGFVVSGHAFFAEAEYVQDKASSPNRAIYFIIGGVVCGVLAIALIIMLGVVCRRPSAAAPDSTVASLADGSYTEGPGEAPKSSGSF